MFDVIVIGAGPAGTAAAYDLLSVGMTVLIADRYAFPRKKACAGGITPKALKSYRYDISSQVKRVCRTVRIRKRDQKFFLINEKKPLCYMTKRQELDAFCLNKVIEKGGRFKIVKKIASIQEKSGHVEIRTDTNIFKARFVIGADGSNSRVRQLTCDSAFWQIRPALEADVFVDDPGKYPMEFDFSCHRHGYFWIFPKDDHVNIGIYSTRRFKGAVCRDRLVAYARKRIGTGRLESLKGYPICTGGQWYQPESQRIFLVGDAAGMAEPLLGEGIYFAVKSGQIAAGSIIGSGMKPDKSTLPRFAHRLQRLKRDLKIHGFSANVFFRFPGLSLSLLKPRIIHGRFSKGYAAGKPLSRILLGRR